MKIDCTSNGGKPCLNCEAWMAGVKSSVTTNFYNEIRAMHRRAQQAEGELARIGGEPGGLAQLRSRVNYMAGEWGKTLRALGEITAKVATLTAERDENEEIANRALVMGLEAANWSRLVCEAAARREHDIAEGDRLRAEVERLTKLAMAAEGVDVPLLVRLPRLQTWQDRARNACGWLDEILSRLGLQDCPAHKLMAELDRLKSATGKGGPTPP